MPTGNSIFYRLVCTAMLFAVLTPERGMALVNTNAINSFPPADEVSFFDIPQMWKEIRDSSARLRTELNTLPRLNEALQFDAYGYHGGYIPAQKELPEEPRWTLEVEFEYEMGVTQIILVPAIDHRFGKVGSYGFPRRFRIMATRKHGYVATVKEWIREDCPDPGHSPLIIDVPRAKKVRIEVFRGQQDGDKEFFALDELYGFTGSMITAGQSVEVSSEYEAPPYWDKQFLIDQHTSLGLPLGAVNGELADTAKNDFSAVFDRPLTNGCMVELDLGKNQGFNTLTFFPAQPPRGIMLPGYGFPGKIRAINTVREKETGGRGRSFPTPRSWENLDPGNNVFAVTRATFPQRRGRWIQIFFDDFPIHDGKPTFAMGEIVISKYSDIRPIAGIRLEGFPHDAVDRASLMADGYSGGQQVSSLNAWLQQLEERRLVLRKLETLTELEASLRQRWRKFWQRSGMGAGALIVFAAISIAVIAVSLRRHHSARLRQQINSDLHDDIGSKVAAISLASTYVEQNAEEPLVRKRGARIHTIALGMHQALRDVLWLTDTRTDTLNQLMQRLSDCARMSIAAERLSLKASPLSSIPSRFLNVQVKRDLLLFFKEALHNAASHSEATQIDVEVALHGKTLTLKVQDNGKGFDLTGDELSAMNHHGLTTMRERGKRLRGRFNIQSSPESGTVVELQVDV